MLLLQVFTSTGFAQVGKYAPFTLSIEAVKDRLDKMPSTHPRLFVRRPDTLEVVSKNIDLKRNGG